MGSTSNRGLTQGNNPYLEILQDEWLIFLILSFFPLEHIMNSPCDFSCSDLESGPVCGTLFKI